MNYEYCQILIKENNETEIEKSIEMHHAFGWIVDEHIVHQKKLYVSSSYSGTIDSFGNVSLRQDCYGGDFIDHTLTFKRDLDMPNLDKINEYEQEFRTKFSKYKETVSKFKSIVPFFPGLFFGFSGLIAACLTINSLIEFISKSTDVWRELCIAYGACTVVSFAIGLPLLIIGIKRICRRKKAKNIAEDLELIKEKSKALVPPSIFKDENNDRDTVNI